MECVTLYSTWPDAQSALRAGEALVEQRLIACANLIPSIQSVFIWEGRIQTGAEAVLLCKTIAAKADEARAALVGLHPYDVPCIVALPLLSALSHAPFLHWIEETVVLGGLSVGEAP